MGYQTVLLDMEILFQSDCIESVFGIIMVYLGFNQNGAIFTNNFVSLIEKIIK